MRENLEVGYQFVSNRRYESGNFRIQKGMAYTIVDSGYDDGRSFWCELKAYPGVSILMAAWEIEDISEEQTYSDKPAKKRRKKS